MNTVLITGAARGIGAATAALFAENGWRVLANYKSSDAAAEALREKTGCLLFRADVSDAAEVEKMRGDIEKRGIEVDALVNNAGTALFGLFQDISPKRAAEMYGTNLFGALNCTRAFLPAMIRRKSGSIVSLASVWGEVGASCEVDYSAAKAAIIGFTKALAKEVGYSGVRVNCVSPGFVDTDMNAELSAADFDAVVDEIPLERAGAARDVAEAVYFLSTDKASYITGETLRVDGGWC